MCKVSDTPEPDTRDSGSGQGSTVGEPTEKFANIKAANRKVRLIDILRHYGIKLEKNHQRPSWSNNIICPLPNHKGSKERTPSFGYCFVSDHFHCLGCAQTGRAVEFISIYERISRSVVADRILAQYGEDVSSEDFHEYEDDITPIILEGSKFLQEQIQKNKTNQNKINQIEKLIWWLDFYLMQKAQGQNINADDLKYRINRVKELLSDELFDSR